MENVNTTKLEQSVTELQFAAIGNSYLHCHYLVVEPSYNQTAGTNQRYQLPPFSIGLDKRMITNEVSTDRLDGNHRYNFHYFFSKW